jgi:hypothetical protein
MLAGAVPAGTPAHVIGYSFGAWIALRIAAEAGTVARIVAIAPPLGMLGAGSDGAVRRPVGLVAAERDQFCSLERLAAYARAHGDRVTIHAVIPGADHFFAGAEREVATAVREFLDAPWRRS